MKISKTVCLVWSCTMLSSMELYAQEIAAKSFSLSGMASLEYIEGSEISTYQKQSDYSGAFQANYFLWKDISLILGYRYGIENRVSSPLAAISYKNEHHGGYIQLRKYWFFNRYLGVYLGAEYGYRVGTIENHKVDLADKEYQHNVNLVPGIFVFPLKKLGIEMSYGNIGYRSLTLTDETGQNSGSSSNFNLNLMPKLNLGIHYFILRK